MGLSALCASALLATVVARPEIHVTVSKAEAQAKVAEELPRTIEKSLLTMTVTEVGLDFLPSNRVHVTAEVDLEGAGFDGHATVDATSGLRYEDGRFYLADASLGDVRLSSSAESQARVADAEAIGEGLWARMKDRLAGDDPEAGSALDRMRARALEAALPALREHLDEIVRDTPVYSLEDQGMKGWLARAALVDVDFTEDSAVARLDPGRLILKVLGFVLLALLAGLAGLGFTASLMAPSRT